MTKLSHQNVPTQMQIFLERMLVDAGLNIVDAKNKQVIIVDLYAKLDEFLGATIEENLPDDQLVDYFTLLANQAKTEEIQTFLRQTLPNLDEIIAQTMLEFRQMYLSSISTE